VIIALRFPGAVFSIEIFQAGKAFGAAAGGFGRGELEEVFDDLRIDAGAGFKVDDDPEFSPEISSTRGLEPEATLEAVVSGDQYDGTSTVLGGKGPLDLMFGVPISAIFKPVLENLSDRNALTSSKSQTTLLFNVLQRNFLIRRNQTEMRMPFPLKDNDMYL